MKVLVSAPACNPYLGSEAGVGWAAVSRIAKNHEVFVLTESNNRRDWLRAKSEGLIPDNIQVHFLGRVKKYSKNRFLARIQSWLWYVSFSNEVLKAARTWHQKEKFDLCHQVTIATWRVASPLWKLPIPFIWGPIGGAGNVPQAFRQGMSMKARAFELARDISNFLSSHSSSFLFCIRKAAVVFAANHETLEFLKKYRGDRPLVRLPNFTIGNPKIQHLARPDNQISDDETIRLFAGGNIMGTKGVYFAIRALEKVKSAGISFHYIVAGGGPELDYLETLVSSLDLKDNVSFHPGYSGDAYRDVLHKSDIYFLPSFRETTGMTLVEAIVAGCYPIVADISAQGEIVRHTGGKLISMDSPEELITGLAEAVIWCANHRKELGGNAARERKEKLIDYFSSEKYEFSLNQAYQLSVNTNHSKI